MQRIVWKLPVVAMMLSACSVGPRAVQGTGQAKTAAPAPHRSDPSAPAHTATESPKSPASRPPEATPTSRPPESASAGSPASPLGLPAAPGGGPARFPPTATGILDGKVIVVDPGHNGGNASAPSILNHPTRNCRETESCHTTASPTQ